MTTYKTNNCMIKVDRHIGNSLLVRLERKKERNTSALFMVGGILKGDFPKLFVETLIKQRKMNDILEKTDVILLTAPLKKNLLDKTLPNLPEVKEIANELNDNSYKISPFSMKSWFNDALLKFVDDYRSVNIASHSFSGMIAPFSLLELKKNHPALAKKIKKISLFAPYLFNPAVRWAKFENIEKIKKIEKSVAHFYPAVDQNFSADTIKILKDLFDLSQEINKSVKGKNSFLNIIVHPRDEFINTNNKFEALYALMKKLGVNNTSVYFDESNLRFANENNKIHHSYHEMIINNSDLIKKVLL